LFFVPVSGSTCFEPRTNLSWWYCTWFPY